MVDNKISIIKQKINAAVDEIKQNHSIISIYAGQTSKSVTERLEQHIREDSKFVGMEAYELTSIDIHSPKLAAKAEQYLINKINDLYGQRCINSKNEDGTVSQMGGVGESQKYESHRLYVLIKFAKPQINFV